jgi:tetratricopeptide (TPR) repeat protein
MIRTFLLLIALINLTGCMHMAQSGAIKRAEDAYNDGKYERALTRLSQAERYTTPTAQEHAQILFLRAQSYEALHRLPDAIGCYKNLIETYPTSAYTYQARERLKALEATRAPAS